MELLASKVEDNTEGSLVIFGEYYFRGDIMFEEWKDIIGYEGIYQVSNF